MIRRSFISAFVFACAAATAVSSPSSASPLPAYEPSAGRPVYGVEGSSSLQSFSGRSPDAQADLLPTSAFEFLAANAGTLGIRDARKQFKVESSSFDSLGIGQVMLQQYAADLPVLGIRLSFHLDPRTGRTTVIGRASAIGDTLPAPKITPDAASAVAEDAWTKEFGLASTVRKAPVLQAVDLGLLTSMTSGGFYAGFVVDLGGPHAAKRYVVDAASGALLWSVSRSPEDVFRGVFDCSNQGGCILDTFSATYNYTFGRSEGQPARGPSPRTDLPIVASYPNETDRLYDILGYAHEYYFAKQQRDGANGVGGLSDGATFPVGSTIAASYADFFIAPLGCPNARFNSSITSLEFCAGLVMLDVSGHEYTHALTYYTAGLEYVGESGALNESFSDIFGEAIERFVLGNHDWLLGSNSIPETSLIGVARSMISPSDPILNPLTHTNINGLQPDRFYNDLFSCNAQSDNGGVHQNSGVFNHLAYLIAAGGTFNGCTITGLGEDKEEKIFYRALTTYLTPVSNFYAAYLAVRGACLDLYRVEDCLEVERALRAVELPQPGPCSGTPVADVRCAELVDQCPDVPNQVIASECGCGVPAVDANSNGVIDCVENRFTAQVPPAPVVKAGKQSLKITMTPPTDDVSYLIKVTSGAGKSKKTKSYPSVSPVKTIKNLKSGAVTVTYLYKLKSAPAVVSKESAKKKTVIK